MIIYNIINPEDFPEDMDYNRHFVVRVASIGTTPSKIVKVDLEFIGVIDPDSKPIVN